MHLIYFLYVVLSKVKIMYYKEKIIDGVYYYKNSPNSQWTPLSNKALTSKIIALQKLVDEAY